VVVMLAATTAHAQVDADAPAGWVEAVEASKAQQSMLAQPGTRDARARLWKASEGVGSFGIMETVGPLQGRSADELIFEAERRSMAQLPSTWKHISSTRNDEKQRATLDTTYEYQDIRMQVRRYYVPLRTKEMHTVIVTCNEPRDGTACAPALASVRVDIPDAIDLTDTQLKPKPAPPGPSILYVVVPIAIGLVVLLVVIMRRQDRRRPRRAAAADR
jgi:hypothetical protein